MQYMTIADIVGACALLIATIGLLSRYESTVSSRRLALVCIIDIVQLLADAAAYSINGPLFPEPLLYLINGLAYGLGLVMGLALLWYCDAFIGQRANAPKALFRVPMAIMGLALVYMLVCLFGGQMLEVRDGYAVITGGMPALCSIILALLPIYNFIASFSQRSKVGTTPALALGAYAIFPISATAAAMLGLPDFSTVSGAMGILVIITLLQNNYERELEQEKQEALTAANARLEEAAAEQEAQIEEITALNEAAAAQRAANEKDMSIVEALSANFANVYLIQRSTRTLEIVKLDGYVTQGLEKGSVKRYPFDAAVEAYIGPRVLEEDKPAVREFLGWDQALAALERDGASQLSYRVIQDGEVHHYQGRLRNVNDPDFFVAGFQCIDDVVAKEQEQNRQMERAKKAAEAANEAKTSFLFNMSHDIRTPMNAIIGFTELLRKNQDDPERREDYLNKIEDSSQVLLNIINNVLDMARIEKGETSVFETAWSARQLSESICNVFSEMMEEKGLEFVSTIDIQHEYVYCDATKLTQVFNNILSNAYKYTNPGGRIEMRLEEQPCDREGYALMSTTVSDTGIGMDAEYLPHLFEEFSREHTSTETKIQGTGLGMPIVKRLVDLMGGTIEVSSQKGVGSTFVVTIPHRISSKDDLVQAGSHEFDPALFQGKRILLAEDNDLNAEIAIAILTEAGLMIERAEDGSVAVDMLLKAPMDYYDAVLMDIQMPRMNGYEATGAIRAMGDTAKARIPILAMTANAFEEDRRAALDAGMNGHIAKPINMEELMCALAGVLG